MYVCVYAYVYVSSHRGSGVEERLRDKGRADEGGADDELVGGGQRSVDPRHEELPPKLALVHLDKVGVGAFECVLRARPIRAPKETAPLPPDASAAQATRRQGQP